MAMAKKIYFGNISQEPQQLDIKKFYIGNVYNVPAQVKKAYVGNIDGIPTIFYSSINDIRFTYSGRYELKRDPDNINWELILFDSGELNILEVTSPVDIFMVGGGGTGGNSGNKKDRWASAGGSGGQGGECLTLNEQMLDTNKKYSIHIGSHDEDTIAFNQTAKKGAQGSNTYYHYKNNVYGTAPTNNHNGGLGGYSGCGGNDPNNNGGNGENGHFAFNDPKTIYQTGFKYGAGGGGSGGFGWYDTASGSAAGKGGTSGGGNARGYGWQAVSPSDALANSGGGGGGGEPGDGTGAPGPANATLGGSGIIIIRNHKVLPPPPPRLYIHENISHTTQELQAIWKPYALKYSAGLSSSYNNPPGVNCHADGTSLQMWMNTGPQAGIIQYSETVDLSNYTKLHILYSGSSMSYNSSIAYFGFWSSFSGMSYQSTNRLGKIEFWNATDQTIDINLADYISSDYLNSSVNIGFGLRSSQNEQTYVVIKEMYFE